MIRDLPLFDSAPAALGFLTDSTLCIGCKACEVACKQWNQLPMDGLKLTANSYDNTYDLGATTWRHVAFVERLGGSPPPFEQPAFQSSWLMLSDVCKHCVKAGCMEACPTGAIIRSEYDTVVIQQDICNGCGYCIPACPFGVPELSMFDGKAHKCTLCYDRLKDNLEPACAKACPTDSIQFGRVDKLRERAHDRVRELKSLGVSGARVYGDTDLGGTNGIGGLNAMFVLTDEPEVYNLPARPKLPQDEVLPGLLSTLGAAALLGLGLVFSFRRR
jgi:formate dehydrogenase iron-sulfur subunit